MTEEKKQVEGLTPTEIVEALDKYVIGQAKAKKMVAIALRNRARRKLLPENLRDEVSPKNILMIGPTGVGKTEVSRRLSKLSGAPFLKVEASKFTEVGYVGRDCESMVRDLTELGVQLVRSERRAEVIERATQSANERILDLLLPGSENVSTPATPEDASFGIPGVHVEPAAAKEVESDAADDQQARFQRTREKLRKSLEAGDFEDREVEFTSAASGGGLPGNVVGFGMGGGESEMMGQMQEMVERMMPQKPKQKKLPIRHARQMLIEEESDRLLDMDKIVVEALERVQQEGIIFIDEIDKIAGRGGGGGPDVSREGVQRDILPIIEGSTVSTKYGMISTEHILFIGAGAFHVAKPSDLIPELQGRFPLRVELDDLGQEEFRRILTEPDNALTKQYQALMATEGVQIEYSEDGIDQLAESAYRVNQETENIGARRLHTVMEKVFEDISFHASEMPGQSVMINKAHVDSCLAEIIKDQDLSKFIL